MEIKGNCKICGAYVIYLREFLTRQPDGNLLSLAGCAKHSDAEAQAAAATYYTVV